MRSLGLGALIAWLQVKPYSLDRVDMVEVDYG